MLPCTNTRSEDAALEGQGFKPFCLSTPILGSPAVQLVHHGERLARLSDCAAHPAGHTRTKTRVGCSRRRDRAAFSGGALGPELAARGSRRKGGRPGRLDRDRDNADRAAAAKLATSADTKGFS